MTAAAAQPTGARATRRQYESSGSRREPSPTGSSTQPRPSPPHPPITPSHTAAFCGSGRRHGQPAGLQHQRRAGGREQSWGTAAAPRFRPADATPPPPLRTQTTRCTPWTAARGRETRFSHNTRCGRLCAGHAAPTRGAGVRAGGGSVREVRLHRVCGRPAPPFVLSARRRGAAPHLPPHAHRARHPPPPPSPLTPTMRAAGT